MSTARQLCTFFLDGTLFGLDVHDVQEVVPRGSLTPVPTAAAAVAGVINLRGQIVTAIDLRTCLEFPPAAEGAGGVHLVVRLPGEVASFLVDDVGDVLEVHERDFEPPPKTLRGALAELVQGTYKLPRQVLLMLDARRLVERVRTAHHAP